VQCSGTIIKTFVNCSCQLAKGSSRRPAIPGSDKSSDTNYSARLLRLLIPAQALNFNFGARLAEGSRNSDEF
jgi:hypothetical protein